MTHQRYCTKLGNSLSDITEGFCCTILDKLDCLKDFVLVSMSTHSQEAAEGGANELVLIKSMRLQLRDYLTAPNRGEVVVENMIVVRITSDGGATCYWAVRI